MDELNQNTQNSSDFQKEKMQKKNNEDNNATICDMQTDSESANNDISIKNEIIGTENIMITSEDANEQLNKNCSLNRKKDEKLKNISYASIPFILAAIIISLFNMGKVRQPLSFLLLSIGLVVLGITYFIRRKFISSSCSCKDCLHQSKNCMKYGILYSIAALGPLGAFIYYMVI